jgi:hypothetical protein
LLVLAGAVGAAAFFLLRRGEESDYDDYGEDAFRYEDETEGATASSEGGFSQSGSISGSGNGAGSDYNGISSSGESTTAG